MTEFTETHMRVTNIELAAKIVSEYGAMYRHTPGFPACDEERAIRLARFEQYVDELRVLLNSDEATP